MPPFDPAIAEWLRKRAADTTVADTSLAGQRAHSRAVNAKAQALLADTQLPAAEVDTRLPGPVAVPVRILRPATEPAATVVYFHGGGWIAGDLDTHLQHVRRLCLELPATVISVDYRLAPENPFPAAFDDCLAVTRASAAAGGVLVVAGDSAGGQLAASVAIACRDQEVFLAAQLLIVPVIDARGGYANPATNARYPSRAANAEGYGLTLTGMAEFVALYRPACDDWRASPIIANLDGVAPAVVHTAGYDVLRDEGQAYAVALHAAGVEVIHRNWPSLNHGYFSLGGLSTVAERAARQAAVDLRELLNRGRAPD